MRGMYHLMIFSAMWLVLGLTACTRGDAASGDSEQGAAAVSAALDSNKTPLNYFQSLRREFAPIGEAQFVCGSDEQRVCDAVETGWGVEQFVRDGSRAILLGQSQVEGQPFHRACTFVIDPKPDKYWDKSFRLVNTQTVHKGQTLLAVFWAKGVKSPQIVDDGAGATLQAYFHTSIGKFSKGRINNFYDCKMLSTDWQRFTIKTSPLPMDFPPGTLSLIGMMGHKAQVVDVGGIAVMAFPVDADLSKLPKPNWDYPGRSPDAPWRKEAEQRIEKYRKGDLTIAVVDATGKPIPNAQVHVRQRKHAFLFGVAVRVGSVLGHSRGMSSEDMEQYRRITTQYYNGIVAENALKWVMYESARKDDWRQVKECLDFYKNQGMWIRGHVLVWPTIYRTPEPLRTRFIEHPQLLGPGVLSHVVEEVTEFKPWIDDWDVTNETEVNRDFMDKLGPQAMVEWYKAARQASPHALLTYNEPHFGSPGMEIGSFPENLLAKDRRGWVDYLIQQGAPLDNIGSQCHGGSVGMDFAGKSGPEGLWAYYDHLASYYKRKLQYTELDVNIGDPSDPDQLAYQADKLRDSIIIAFAHPAFRGVTQWGFWAGSHYAPNAALWNRDWSIRPAGQAYIDLVTKRWHTDADLTTGADGTCTVRAFYGSYDITVDSQGTAPVHYDFSEGQGQLRVTLSQ